METASRSFVIAAILAFLAIAATPMTAQDDIYDRVTNGYAVSEGGVKIHYASLGPKDTANAPLVVMIHGFPRLLVLVAASDGDAGG
jgi:hypothetical protein